MKITLLGKLVLALLPMFVFVPLFIGSRLFFSASRDWTDLLLAFASATLMGFNPLVVHSTSSKKRWMIFIAGFVCWVAILFFLALIIMGAVFGDGL